MKKLMVVLFVMSLFSFIYAQETSEPVTNEDKMEENAGKEEAAAPAVASNSAGESKFNKFMNRKGKKALAGVKGGLNISHIWGNDSVWYNDSHASAGYFFGAFFEYAFIKNFSIQAELNFSDKGDNHYSMEYFEIPVIANGIIPVNDMVWINAGAGLYAAFSYGWWGYSRNVIDGGAVFKAGVEINTKVGVFVGDLRYTLGFAEVWDGFDNRNGVFSILVGYAVPLPF